MSDTSDTTAATPAMSVTEPPSPSETVTPNDVWTVRLAVGGLVSLALILAVGLIVLVNNGRTIPDGMWVLVPIAPTALATLATTRGVRAARAYRRPPLR